VASWHKKRRIVVFWEIKEKFAVFLCFYTLRTQTIMTQKNVFSLRFLLVALLLVGLRGGLEAQSLTYHLSMPAPQTHYFEVEIEVRDWNEKELTLKMPTWAPGSYLIREFARHVEGEKAVGSKGEDLPFQKISKNAWKVQTQDQKHIKFSYRVYAFEHSVRTSFIDISHGYINGSSVFMWAEGLQEKETHLHITPYREWKKIATALPTIDNDPWKRSAENYDLLIDSPIEIGNHHSFFFDAQGIRHEVAIYGDRLFDEEKLKNDMKQIVLATTAMFKEHPCKEYVFIIHNVAENNGGLEHLNSTTLIVNRFAYQSDAGYLRFLSLVAHEYFHLWNVKRIRPVELGPFDYDSENYTRLLWVAEGITSYYDELLLMRAGFISENEYLSKLEAAINQLERRKGRNVQSVAESSFDTWIKFYRQNENSANSTISYYNAGTVYAALLDLTIVSETQGKRSLDDLMQYLYDEYFKKQNRGFTEEEFKSAAEKIAGTSLTDFFQKYIYGVEVPDYESIFKNAGIEVKKRNRYSIDLGARIADENNALTVKSVERESIAHKYGLNVNDEILAISGYRVRNIKEFQNVWNLLGDKQTVQLLVARDNKIESINITTHISAEPTYQLVSLSDTSKKEKKVFEKWLAKP
jgi:predicted metalloprotease with PDZ domain